MNEQILAEARRLADEVFRPNAEAADQGDIHGQVERKRAACWRDAGYFGLGISPEFGGMGADDVTRREYTELMASACGVTAFTQQQLHAGGGFVGGGRNEALQREKLPLFASGRELCGVAFSHLRRPGPPMVRAERVDGGYRVSGTRALGDGVGAAGLVHPGGDAPAGERPHLLLRPEGGKRSRPPTRPAHPAGRDERLGHGRGDTRATCSCRTTTFCPSVPPSP